MNNTEEKQAKKIYFISRKFRTVRFTQFFHHISNERKGILQNLPFMISTVRFSIPHPPGYHPIPTQSHPLKAYGATFVFGVILILALAIVMAKPKLGICGGKS